MNNDCEYCRVGKNRREREKKENYIITQWPDSKLKACVSINNGTAQRWVNDSVSLFISYFNYCPMCGRRLKKTQEYNK
jgi:hypothetical protein